MENEKNINDKNLDTSTPTSNCSNQIPEPEGYHKKKYPVAILSEETINTINGVQKRMDIAFSKFVLDKQWSNVKVVDKFYPYISGDSAVSKILNGTQHVSLNVILLLALCYGLPLDEILLGKKQSGYMLTPDDVAYLEKLVKKATSCSDRNN